MRAHLIVDGDFTGLGRPRTQLPIRHHDMIHSLNAHRAGWILVGIATCGLWVSTVGSVLSTQQEVQRYLGMPDYVGAVPENMQAAISQSLPIGSSQTDVERFLSMRGIGYDRGSTCSVNPNGIDITCEIGADRHRLELVHETFNFLFTFDLNQRLSSITVTSRFSPSWHKGNL
jgi:hypothetical protein